MLSAGCDPHMSAIAECTHPQTKPEADPTILPAVRADHPAKRRGNRGLSNRAEQRRSIRKTREKPAFRGSLRRGSVRQPKNRSDEG